MFGFMKNKFRKPKVDNGQVKEISRLLVVIIGQTVSGKLARAALVGAVTFGSVYMQDEAAAPSTPDAAIAFPVDDVIAAAARLVKPAPIPDLPGTKQ